MRRFIHFSTDEVYGESLTDVPFTESTGVLKPTNPYSASKASKYNLLLHIFANNNIKIIRCNNVYGPNQYPEKLIPKFKRLLKEGKTWTFHALMNVCGRDVKRAFMRTSLMLLMPLILYGRTVKLVKSDSSAS